MNFFNRSDLTPVPPMTEMNRANLVVEEAARYLDEIKPGWHKRVSLQDLDMRDAHYCVLGQAFGRWWRPTSGYMRAQRKYPRLQKQYSVVLCSNLDLESWRHEIRERKNTRYEVDSGDVA